VRSPWLAGSVGLALDAGQASCAVVAVLDDVALGQDGLEEVAEDVVDVLSDQVLGGIGAVLDEEAHPVEILIDGLGLDTVGIGDRGAAIERVVAEDGGADQRIGAGVGQEIAASRVVGERGDVGGAVAGRIDVLGHPGRVVGGRRHVAERGVALDTFGLAKRCRRTSRGPRSWKSRSPASRSSTCCATACCRTRTGSGRRCACRSRCWRCGAVITDDRGQTAERERDDGIVVDVDRVEAVGRAVDEGHPVELGDGAHRRDAGCRSTRIATGHPGL
jgi:hypothetical protein